MNRQPGLAMSGAGATTGGRLSGPVRATAGMVTALLIGVAGLLAGTGWLYVFRGLHWFATGPRIDDSLPLLQLPGFDGQPLLRVVIAWLLAGTVTGVAMIGVRPTRRFAFAGLLGLVALLVAAQVAYALARNLRLTDVVFVHAPGLGPVLAALIFALGCSLPRRSADRQRVRVRRRSLVSVVTGFDDRGMRGGEHRHGRQDDDDRQ
jgi:hypothetical protein